MAAEKYPVQIPFVAGQVLSPEAVVWIQKLVEEVQALRTQVDDHETRITALEP